MQELKNYAISLPLAASIIDSALFQSRHPNYAELSQLLSHLRQDSSSTIVDLSQSLVPALLKIASANTVECLNRSLAGRRWSSRVNVSGGSQLRVGIGKVYLQRISAVRILGRIRDIRAEVVLQRFILNRRESISLRIAAVQSLRQANEKRCLGAITELFSECRHVLTRRCHFVLTNDLEDHPKEETGREPEFFLRECIQQLGRMGREDARQIILRLLHNRNLPLALRQFAFDVGHASPIESQGNSFRIIKLLSVLK